MKKSFFLLIFLPFASSGQSDFYYPLYFTAYFQNMALINPGYVPAETKSEFIAGYRSMTGAFRKVAGYYASGERHFKSNSGREQVLRLQFINDKEGSYISTPRYYVNYAFLLPLRDNLEVYSGVSFGGISMQYAAPTTTIGSFTKPDGALGLGLKSAWFDVGASMLQPFNSGRAGLVFHRYYHLHGSAEKLWEEGWGCRGRFLVRHLPKVSDEFTLSGSVFNHDKIELGVSLSQHIVPSLFLIFGTGEEDLLKIMINYNSTFLGRAPAWQNSIEAGLAYTIK